MTRSVGLRLESVPVGKSGDGSSSLATPWASRQLIIIASLAACGVAGIRVAPGSWSVSAALLAAFLIELYTKSLIQGIFFLLIASMATPTLTYAPYLLLVPSIAWQGPSRRVRGGYGAGGPSSAELTLWLALLTLVLVTALRAVGTSGLLLIQLGLLAVMCFNMRAARGHQAMDASPLSIAASVTGAASVYAVESWLAVASGGPNAWAAASLLDGWANRNLLAVVFALGFAYFIDHTVRGTPRLVSLLFCFILLSATALTFSRSGYVALILGGVVCLYRIRRSLLLLAPLAIAASQYLSGPVLQRIEYTRSAGGLDPSSSVRLELWGAAWQTAIEHPVTGVGIESLSHEFQVRGFGPELAFAHNTFLTVLAGYGFMLPLLAILCFLGRMKDKRSSERKSGMTLRRKDGRIAGVIVVGSASFFGEPLFVASVFGIVLPFLLVPWYVAFDNDEHYT